jgi:hypothetical protein
MVNVDGPQKLEGIFEGYKQYAGAWSETQCTFFVNGKLVQVETYHDCTVNPPLGDALFDPSKLIRSH